MAKLFTVSVTTSATREVKVVAETAEEAQGKVTLSEGETVVNVAEDGEVTV